MRKHPEWFAVVAASLTTLVLSLRGLADRSFWLDEGVSGYAVTGPTSALKEELERDPYFILYHLLLKVWSVFGSTDFQLRLFSVLFAVLTIPVLYALAVRLFDRRVACVAVVLLSINGLFLGYAQEARPYALAVFTTTLATLCLVRAMDAPDQSWPWRWWVFAATAAVLTHPFGAIVAVAHIVVLVARRRTVSVPLRTVARAAVVPGVLVGALAIALLTIGPSRLINFPTLDFQLITKVACELCGTRHRRQFLAYMLCVAGGVVAVVRADGDRRRRLALGVALAGWLLVALLLVPFVESIVGPVVLIPRYLLVGVPPLTLLVAAGIGQLRLVLATVVTGALIVVALPSATAPIRDEPLQGWRDAAAIIRASATRDDVVIVVKFGLTPLRFYLDPAVARTAAPLEVTNVTFGARATTDLRPCRLGRVWLIVGFGLKDDVSPVLHDTHSNEQTDTLPGMTLTRLEPRADQPCS